MPIESLVSVACCRGLTMQTALERNSEGGSSYSMVAVNPSRISKTFNEQALQYVVDNIRKYRGRDLMVAGGCELQRGEPAVCLCWRCKFPRVDMTRGLNTKTPVT